MGGVYGVIQRVAEISFLEKAQAQEFHDQLKAEFWRVAQLGEKSERSWDEAAYRWLTETGHKKSHHEDVTKVAWLQQFFRGKCLEDLTREAIAKVAN